MYRENFISNSSKSPFIGKIKTTYFSLGFSLDEQIKADLGLTKPLPHDPTEKNFSCDCCRLEDKRLDDRSISFENTIMFVLAMIISVRFL